jgi:hypothetical protein
LRKKYKNLETKNTKSYYSWEQNHSTVGAEVIMRMNKSTLNVEQNSQNMGNKNIGTVKQNMIAKRNQASVKEQNQT